LDKLVVVGGVAAGTTAAARARRCCQDGQITIYEQEEYVSYSA
jgi:NADPH-dependent 2,4-dienoyl-CoA reductase/sulfur reductase-like enzyme